MATTELQSTLTAAQTDIPYGSIATYDGTTITDGSVLALSIDGIVQVLDTDYTVDTVNQDLVLTVAATGGELAVVTRVTEGDSPYVDFTNNTVVDADDVDLAIKQLLFLIQETVTSIGDFLTYSTLNAYWDGENRTTSNFMPAATSTGLTTLSQVNDLISGVSTASIDNVTEWTFTPSTPTTTFNLTSAPQGLASGEELLVWINGVHQRNTAGYTFTAGSTPSITTASLTSGDTLHVLAFSGTVSTTFADGSIDSDALGAGAVTAAKVGLGTGDDKRVLISNTSGTMTGRTLVHTDVSDFDAGVQANTVDSLAAATDTLDMGGYRVRNIATSTGQPNDAVNVSTMNAAIAAVSVPNVYTKSMDVVNGAPDATDVGFAPLTCLAQAGGTVAFEKLESGDSFTVGSNTVSASGTTVTVTRTSGGTTSDFALTVFG